MQFGKIFFQTVLGALAFFVCACGPSVSIRPPAVADFEASSYPAVGSYTSNSMTITATATSCENGNTCDNIPLVSVTLCSMNQPTQCQTIDNILLDTGSTGIRVFHSVISSSILAGMLPLTSGSYTLGECYSYGSGAADWGSVQLAYVGLAGEPEVAVPIQVIDAGYKNPPTACSSANVVLDTTPAEAGFNGILGVMPLPQDCGSDCLTDSANGLYFTCDGSSCSGGATVGLSAQVAHVTAALPMDNNGLIISFASIANAGVTSATGTMTIGIGTRGALPSTPVTLSADASSGVPEFIANTGSSFDNNSSNWLSGFIDSGSPFYYIPTNLPDCGGELAGFFCPTSNSTVTFTNTSVSSLSTNSSVSLSVFNAETQLDSSNGVFANVAISSQVLQSGIVDYGLPFFFGRTIYFGMQGKSSSLGSGSYYAY